MAFQHITPSLAVLDDITVISSPIHPYTHTHKHIHTHIHTYTPHTCVCVIKYNYVQHATCAPNVYTITHNNDK